MYERFTDRARLAMRHANAAAQNRGQQCIDTVDILLGLLQDRGSIVGGLFQSLGVSYEQVWDQVRDTAVAAAEPAPSEKLPQTASAKQVIEHAIESAREMGNNYVGTEHLLLGLLREEEGAACKILRTFGLAKEAYPTSSAVYDAVKGKAKEPCADAPDKKQDAINHGAEAVRMISHVLLSHYASDSDAYATLEQIHKIIHDCL